MIGEFDKFVDKHGPAPQHRPELGACWLWTGTLSKGYGQVRVDGKRVPVHRYAYIKEHGSIADALDVDHLCRTRNCVRPSHLEAVTAAENIRRGRPFRDARRDGPPCLFHYKSLAHRPAQLTRFGNAKLDDVRERLGRELGRRKPLAIGEVFEALLHEHGDELTGERAAEIAAGINKLTAEALSA